MGFDADLNAWVFSSYDSVAAALRHPSLTVSGSPETDLAEPAKGDTATDPFSPSRAQSWRSTMEQSARACADSFPKDQPVDLLQAFAAPWSRQLALSMAGASEERADQLLRLAGEVFAA